MPGLGISLRPNLAIVRDISEIWLDSCSCVRVCLTLFDVGSVLLFIFSWWSCWCKMWWCSSQTIPLFWPKVATIPCCCPVLKADVLIHWFFFFIAVVFSLLPFGFPYQYPLQLCMCWRVCVYACGFYYPLGLLLFLPFTSILNPCVVYEWAGERDLNLRHTHTHTHHRTHQVLSKTIFRQTLPIRLFFGIFLFSYSSNVAMHGWHVRMVRVFNRHQLNDSKWRMNERTNE